MTLAVRKPKPAAMTWPRLETPDAIGVIAAARHLEDALNLAVRPDLTRPNFEYFPNMAHSARYNAFAANPNFSDGKTLQPPPPGSIPPVGIFAAIAFDSAKSGF